VTDRAAEERRLEEARAGVPWRRWGPYLSERQWGTVREDYSADGDAWNHFTHDQARSRAYRRGEDGLAGVSDEKQRLCFALALWNEKDPILKERVFGLSNGEGNHGEDAKEYWFYLDSTPTHSYMKWLYKYPQRAFPYDDLVRTNAARTRRDLEYELLDTGVFEGDRYFDVFVEYAKAAPEDLFVLVTVVNRGPEAAPIHLLPTLWFRNTWSWGPTDERPALRAADEAGAGAVVAMHPELGDYWLYAGGGAELLFTENETNRARIEGQPNVFPYVKDAFHRLLVGGERDAVNPERRGTKCAAHVRLEIPAQGSRTFPLRLTATGPSRLGPGDPLDGLHRTLAARRDESDAFYESITPPALGEDERRVMRQALAGMLWTKQYYNFNVGTWLRERGEHPLMGTRRSQARNRDWFHVRGNDVISMPDKWEYPWFAAWDLAFHAMPLAMVDPDFAHGQLELMLKDVYLHPNGQIPAYEWNFGDVNPPVHPWAILATTTHPDAAAAQPFLEASFQRLLLSFTWWTNRKDQGGDNVFSGGFLGLDNIGVFDRSAPLPAGGHLDQADGTAWMAFYSQSMLALALEIARHDPAYEDMALKFLGHFIWIASAMNRSDEDGGGMWDEEDGFYYDVLRLPDGTTRVLKVRSTVGLLALCAVTMVSGETIARFPRFADHARDLIRDNRRFLGSIAGMDRPGVAGRYLLSVLDEARLRRVLARMLDEEEFLSPYGIRSLSRWHRDHPYRVEVGGSAFEVAYQPAESDTGMFGGNSNWRGPVWLPVNVLIIRALLSYYAFLGDEFQVECPTRSGRQLTLFEVAREISRRACSIFLRGENGRRPVYGGTERFQTDPHWRDLILFYEYFNGDDGAGLGASHQTGWTGLVARLLQAFAVLEPQDVLTAGNDAGRRRYRRPGAP
jgi:hypothetical protein